MRITETMFPVEVQTLAQRLRGGRLPAAETFRYAMQLADALRRLHDSGKAHGAVTSININLTEGGLELQPAPEWSEGAVTPYTAPEVLEGAEIDSRSDIFSFGAILFEMLTGRRAFEAEGRADLLAAVSSSPVPLSGTPAVDRILAGCLANDPESRTPCMEEVMMQLKLLTVNTRSNDPGAPGSFGREPADSGALRMEMQQLETRFAARLQAHERAVVELQRSTSQAVLDLRSQLATLTAELAVAQTRVPLPSAEGTLDPAAVDRLNHLERRFEEFRLRHAEFERNTAADLIDIEAGLKRQAAELDSNRSAMGQTDDVVERIVEAIESLQIAVADRADAERAACAVN